MDKRGGSDERIPFRTRIGHQQRRASLGNGGVNRQNSTEECR
jgi:hypothetical protein